VFVGFRWCCCGGGIIYGIEWNKERKKECEASKNFVIRRPCVSENAIIVGCHADHIPPSVLHHCNTNCTSKVYPQTPKDISHFSDVLGFIGYD
jgi:hypothetical protein